MLLENPRRVPFPQWGGSAQYAARLAAILPQHDVYIEPFCGAAALFFSKEPARKEILADLDPEVTFALRYIQGLNGHRTNALLRFPWRVSRKGFQLVQRVIPASNSERLWKHIYCRTATWGAKPTCVGYSTLHDGDTFNIDELWRFKERLRNARILTQDWKRTLRQYGHLSDALFFIDPPYIDEWSVAKGISPEEIAAEVGRLRAHLRYRLHRFGARAHRAYANSGRQFKLRIMETKRFGAFARRTRLFVRSWD